MSEALSVKVGELPSYQPFEPFVELGLIVIVVAGLVLSTSTVTVVDALLPTLSVPVSV